MCKLVKAKRGGPHFRPAEPLRTLVGRSGKQGNQETSGPLKLGNNLWWADSSIKIPGGEPANTAKETDRPTGRGTISLDLRS